MTEASGLKVNASSGEVTIDLSGTTVTLIPSIRATIEISRRFGGLRNAVLRLLDFDVEAIMFVLEVGAGIDQKSPREKKQLQDLIFDTGFQNLNLQAIDFINLLSNGGRPIEPEKEEDKETKKESSGPA